MQMHKFPVMVWKDSAGFYTAALADPEGVAYEGEVVAAYAPDAKRALLEIKEYLKWFYAQNPWAEGPEVSHSRLVRYKVQVRPEYRVGGKLYPYERSLTLTVAVVDCVFHSGMRAAVLPLFGVQFFYSQGQLRDLVKHYVREHLSGYPPRVLSRFLPPEEVFLETISVRNPVPKDSGRYEPDLDALKSVAEALGTRFFKVRFSRPYGRDAQVKELVERLEAKSNVLLLGESGSGKTSILLEAVRKLEKGKPEEGEYKHRHWLTRGARVIAGMAYLGQWEARMEQVIEELSWIEGVLCAESLSELMRTGGRSAEDGIGAFLAPYLERGELRMVAEATPRELDQCRRLLPGFVDLFTVLPVPEFTTGKALEVLSEVVEHLNRKHRLEAPAAIVPECYRLHKRFLPYHSFPGKASRFLAQLFEECDQEGGCPDRQGLVDKFSRETGLPLKLVRDEETLPVAEVEQFFTERVIGQPEACQAVTRLVSTFKAGLNDPERPLGVLLFCGPTGVGKTRMAKTLSECFFGAGRDRERLVRLDMSEYSGGAAAHRLLGDQERPGELIRRVRQQPFTVVLLDEIEKADPEVFDLLLGVFDEGRLTDRWGRTTTFRSAVLIMTSNLGVSALRPVGINQSREANFEAEVMKFFRPEFFNRIDSVVNFTPLEPSHIQEIAELELKELAGREGMTKRALKLEWSAEAVSRLAELGYDARLGARPLKRTIEEKVTVPLARFLVEHPQLRSSTIVLGLEGDEFTLQIR